VRRINPRSLCISALTSDIILRALREDPEQPVGEIAVRRVVVAYPDEPLDTLWERLRESGIQRLPVVEREDPRRLVGFLSVTDIVSHIRWEE